MDKELKAALFDIGQALGKINGRLDKLEGKDAAKDPGGDGPTRVQPIRVVRAAAKKTTRQKPTVNRRTDRGHSRGSDQRNPDTQEETLGGGEVRKSLEDRRKDEVAALDGGVHGAVASFAPPDAPQGPPSRSVEVKIIWNEGDVIPCQSCKEPVYHVIKQLTSASKLSSLTEALEPYSETIPRLTAKTPVKNIGGVWFNCPRCFKEWGVTVV